MWIVGTDEGTTNYPNEEYMKVADDRKSFKLIELQDSYQLKAYLGKSMYVSMYVCIQVSILVAMYERAIKKEEIEDAKRMTKGQPPMEDIVYNHFEEVNKIIEDNHEA